MNYSADNTITLEFRVAINSTGVRNVLEMSNWCKAQNLVMGTDYNWRYNDRNGVFEQVYFYFADENLANWFKIRWE